MGVGGLFRAPAWLIKGGGGGGGGLNSGAAEEISTISGFGTGSTLYLPRSSYGGRHVIINLDNNHYYTYSRPIPHLNLFLWVIGNQVRQ